MYIYIYMGRQIDRVYSTYIMIPGLRSIPWFQPLTEGSGDSLGLGFRAYQFKGLG